MTGTWTDALDAQVGDVLEAGSGFAVGWSNGGMRERIYPWARRVW